MQYYLNEDDVRRLRSLLSAHRNTAPPRRGYEGKVDHEEQQAPEVYVAKTPANGIAARGSSDTGTGTDDDDNGPGYDWCELYRVVDNRSGEPALYPLGAAGVTERVHNLSSSDIAGGEWILVIRDKGGVWWAVTGGGGGDTSFLAMLVGKCYYDEDTGTAGASANCEVDPLCAGGLTPERWIQYSWIRLTDAGNHPPDDRPPCPVTYDQQGTCGGPGCFPAYHTKNRDVPIFSPGAVLPCCGDGSTGTGTSEDLPIEELCVVRLRRGTGEYYLFDDEPWQDLFRRTGDTDEYGLEIAYHYYYDQVDGLWKDGREVRIVQPTEVL